MSDRSVDGRQISTAEEGRHLHQVGEIHIGRTKTRLDVPLDQAALALWVVGYDTISGLRDLPADEDHAVARSNLARIRVSANRCRHVDRIMGLLVYRHFVSSISCLLPRVEHRPGQAISGVVLSLVTHINLGLEAGGAERDQHSMPLEPCLPPRSRVTTPGGPGTRGERLPRL